MDEAAWRLLRAGPHFDDKSDDGTTPLKVAVKNGKTDVANLLRENGAQ